MADTADRDLIDLLTLFLASGKLNSVHVLPVLEQLAGKNVRDPSVTDLLDAVSQHPGPAFERLADHLSSSRFREAQQYHVSRKRNAAPSDEFQLMLGDLPLDAPLGWKTNKRTVASMSSLVVLARDRRYVVAQSNIAPITAAHVEQQYAAARREGLSLPDAWSVDAPQLLIRALEMRIGGSDPELAKDLLTTAQKVRQSDGGPREPNDDETLPPNAAPAELLESYQQATDTSEKRRLLDQLCSSQDTAAAAILKESLLEPWEQERAALILTCRFGKRSVDGWLGWKNWLGRCTHHREQELQQVLRQSPGELFLIWCAHRPDIDAAIIERVEQWCVEHADRINPEQFVERWAETVPPAEWNALTGIVVQTVQRDDVVRPLRPSSVAQPAATRPEPEMEPAAPAGPSLWNDHIQPFIAEQWYMVAGVVMVIAGASLLAFYTWDKHWLVRYTLMPTLLAAFTGALAWMASWIERKDEQFVGTAAILRGAAIGLLPINFMAVALLSNDEQVSAKSLVVPLMGAIYLAVFGYGLRNWCRAVHQPLAWLLGGTLLILNSLVMLGPLATAVASFTDTALLSVIGVGFHLGFLAMASAVVWFSRHVLTRELAQQQRVPWFFGATLVVTFLQVFAWVHGYLQHLPRVSTYAPMIILTGGLVLLVERSALRLRHQEERHGEESFVGFALILLGVLMGSTEPHLRIISFALAGGVWLFQAVARRNAIHDWIALTFFMLAGASVGTLDTFPKPWLPALGLSIAVAMGVGSYIARTYGQERLRTSCLGMHISVLMLTTVVAVLAQWHYLTPPLHTGGCLLLIVALFAFRAWRDDQLKWVHSAMAILSLSLLYLGCVDMVSRTLHGNTMVFGLSMISTFWLVLNACTSHRLVRESRSTVLWVYGAMAVAGMLLRVVAERGTPGDVLWYRQWMDFSGPLLMTVVLTFTTWYSRSLIPAGMAGIIVTILFPELKANLQQTFAFLGWGTGLGSSLSAGGLMVICFLLQNVRFLKDPGEGDRFMGTTLFPMRRYDHSLFTLPILASVLFLTIKTDTLTLVRQWLSEGGVGLKTSIAVTVTGVTWTLLAVYNRSHRFAPQGTFLGCLWLFVGIWYGHHNLAEAPHWTWPVLITGVALQVLWLIYVYLTRSRGDWVARILTQPTRRVLETSSVVVAVVCVTQMIIGRPMTPLLPLMGFVAAQLVWHALSTKNLAYGSVLFLLSWVGLLTYTTPGSGHLVDRLSIQNSLTPTLWMLLGIHAGHLLLEFKQELYLRVRSLTLPFLSAASGMAMALVLIGIGDSLHDFQVSSTQLTLLLVAALLTARAHSSSALALPVLLLTYIHVNRDALQQFAGDNLDVAAQRLEYLCKPVRLATFSCVIAMLGHVGRWLYRQQPFVVYGPFGFSWLRSPRVIWWFAPAAALALLATALHTALLTLREDPVQLWAPYLAAVTFALVGISWWRQSCYQVAVLILTIGNIHCVRFYFGESLRDHGISEIHLICLGTAATLLQGTIVRYALRRTPITVFVNQASLGLAGLILSLLAANYFVHPNLAVIEWQRFLVSGLMAYLAGLYFRRAARQPDHGEDAYVGVCEGLYHFGVTVAMWCAVLLVPAFRHPAVALCALGAPIAYFYVRAESGSRVGLDAARRYRDSAAVLSFVVLGGYVFRAGFQMVMFPDEPIIRTDYYHYNAPFIMLLSVVMLRLHGLGGTTWLAFYGGLALVTGTYFSLTWMPGLSPFDHPMPAAWAAVALSHFWTLVSHQRSPLRTAIQRLAAIDGQQWFDLRRSWGVCLLIATQAAVLFGLLNWKSNTLMVAPLLVGAASILIHQGAIRRSPIYFGLAGVQLFVALHADFLIDSYLAKDHVVWAVIVIWGAILMVHQCLSRRVEINGLGVVAAGLAALTMVHVFYHQPTSTIGLWAVATGAVLAALTPRPTRAAASGEQLAMAGLILLVPTWLMYFSQIKVVPAGVNAMFATWPALCTTAVVFLTGSLAAVFQVRLHIDYDRLQRLRPRLFDQTLSLMGARGLDINTAALYLSFVLTAIVQVMHYGRPFEPRELVLIMALYASYTIGWFFEGRLRHNMVSYILLHVSVVGFFAVARRQLMLTTDFWTPEYDVWASLAVSFGLTGFKQVFDVQQREARIPLMGTLFTLPVVALIWVLYNHMDSNVALLVVGLHSLMFTFMGKDEKESPYNIVALAGFVAFVLIVFWSKLQLRVIHAYTLPVGIGILVLLQVFRRHIEPGARNRIRLATLLIMIGSAGYYALVDDRYPLAFNLTLIVACLAAMALGSFFRIRLYLALGFAGLMVDVGSILFKVMRGMERSSRMTIIGGIVLLVGVGLVFGAIYYKTHRSRINQRLDHLRAKVGAWE
jgi:hypothetical protein